MSDKLINAQYKIVDLENDNTKLTKRLEILQRTLNQQSSKLNTKTKSKNPK